MSTLRGLYQTLIRIADYLETSVDYLITGEYRTGLTSDCQKLVDLYKSVPEFARYKVLCDFEKCVSEEIKKAEEFKDK